jgi:putative oxygen-independent coproporphyrinogen III oxidase
MSPSTIPLSLYIHIPWCVRKCPYCDFNSHAAGGDSLPETEYVSALIADLNNQLEFVQQRELMSIFIGGGTPSLFSPQAIGHILDETSKLIPFARDIEITLEANPGTVDESHFVGFRSAGVNRLSIGIQSFNAAHLKTLGRIHNNTQALNAASAARRTGFERFNLDLMHGLPNQTVAEALDDLQTAIDCAPPHVSWYQLTLEPNTEFHKFPPTLPIDDVLADIQESGELLLAKNGYHRYEISAFSKPNFQCQHNRNYWEFGDYLGIGAGAHGKITASDGAITRTQKSRSPKDYLAGAEKTQLTIVDDRIFDFMLNALRLCDGFDQKLFTDRTGLAYSHIETRINALINDDLLICNGSWIKPTAHGINFLNDVINRFLP